MNQTRYYLFLGLVTLLFISCDKSYTSSIPDYPVQLDLNLTTTYPTFKNSYNKELTFEKKINVNDFIGYGGILVYTGFDGGYYAFDMSCPYEANPKILVHPNGNGQAVCDSCKTIFDISYGIGNPTGRHRLNRPDTTALANQTLKRYKATFSGDILSIRR